MRALKAILYVALFGDLNQGSRKVPRYLIMSSWKALHVPVTWSREENEDASVSYPVSPLKAIQWLDHFGTRLDNSLIIWVFQESHLVCLYAFACF